MSLRPKIVLVNAFVLALAFLAAGLALVGFWRAYAPLHQAVVDEARAVALAEALRGELARAAADAALGDYLVRQEAAARAAERAAARGALAATAALAGLLAMVGAAGAALSLRLSRHLLGRLSTLVDAAGRVATGERKVRIAAPATRGDELDQLGQAFNRMVMQLAEAETAARRVDELKTSFLAAVSHELRTPLTTVKGLLETLRREDAGWDEATRREFLDVAAKESDRLARLVTNLLDLSRLEAGVWPLHCEAVELPVVARTLAEDLSCPGAPLDGYRIELVARAVRPVWADEGQIRRVLENLLTNAAKFSAPGSHIQVQIGEVTADAMPAAGIGGTDGAASRGRTGRTGRSGRSGSAVVVRVRDEGPGIHEQDCPRIFEKFYRATATRAVTPGTGLGLAICRGVVEQHGGRIWVEPDAGGRGSTFGFTLPLAPVTRAVTATRSTCAPAIPAIPAIPAAVATETHTLSPGSGHPGRRVAAAVTAVVAAVAVVAAGKAVT